MSETAAEQALMAERHDDGDGRNATWHMSVNRMGSMLAAIRNEARAGALDATSVAQAIHETFHHGPPTLTCMTKHRVKARTLLAALDAAQEEPKPLRSQYRGAYTLGYKREAGAAGTFTRDMMAGVQEGAYAKGRADALLEAAERVRALPPAEADGTVVLGAVNLYAVLDILDSGEGPAEADPPASAPGPLDPATEGYVVVVDRSLPCPLDPKCYRYQGHDGEHMYAEPPAQQLNHAISDSIASTPPKKKRK